MTARTDKAIPNALKAKSAFKDFRPTQFTQREREPRRYLSPGENLATTLTHIVENGIDQLRTSDHRKGLRVELTEDFKNRLRAHGDGELQTIDLPDVLDILAAKLGCAGDIHNVHADRRRRRSEPKP